MRRAAAPPPAPAAPRVPLGAFTIVMGTGICSLAVDGAGLPELGVPMGALAAGVWAALVLVAAARLARTPRDVLDEAGTFTGAAGLLAFVVATAVLGDHLARHGRADLTAAILVVAVGLWTLMLPLVAVRAARFRAEEDARGLALMPAVAAGGLAVLAAEVARQQGWAGAAWLALALWASALVFYAAGVGAVAARAVRAPRRAAGLLTPDAWILMGALATASLAASEIVIAGRAAGALGGVVGPLEDAGLALWVAATVLIPALAAAEAARRAADPGSLRYSPLRWSTVFPLGMYAVATRVLGEAAGLPALRGLSVHGASWVALGVWALVAAGLVRAVIRRPAPAAAASPSGPPRPCSPRASPRPEAPDDRG